MYMVSEALHHTYPNIRCGVQPETQQGRIVLEEMAQKIAELPVYLVFVMPLRLEQKIAGIVQQIQILLTCCLSQALLAGIW